MLVYRDNFAPGWSVAVDGRPADLLVVDRVNKAVAVPPGEHLVVFKYRPWAFLVAFALRALVLVSAALARLIVLLRTRRRGSLRTAKPRAPPPRPWTRGRLGLTPSGA